MNKRQLLTVTSIYAFATIWLLLLSAVILFLIMSRDTPPESPAETEVVYVYKDQSIESNSTTSEEGWVVREYEEQIAIFRPNGTLVRVLDTYTKTLPEADRRLLREGIAIQTEAELYSLIEDYTE